MAKDHKLTPAHGQGAQLHWACGGNGAAEATVPAVDARGARAGQRDARSHIRRSALHRDRSGAHSQAAEHLLDAVV